MIGGDTELIIKVIDTQKENFDENGKRIYVVLWNEN